MEYHLTLKMIEVLLYGLTWMNIDTRIKLLTDGNVVIKLKRKKIIPRGTHLGIDFCCCSKYYGN